MRRLELSFLLLVASLFAFALVPYPEVGWLLMGLGLALAYPYARSVVEAYVAGVKLHDWEVGEWKLLREYHSKPPRYEVCCVLEAVTTSGTLESIEPLKYALVAKDLVEFLAAEEPVILIHRSEDGLHYYLMLRAEGKSLEEAEESLKNKVSILRRSLFTYNLELHPRRPKVLLEVLGVREKRYTWREYLVAVGLAGLSALLLYYLPLFGLLASAVALPTCVAIVRAKLGKEKRYVLGSAARRWWMVERAETVRFTRSEVYHYTLRVSKRMTSRAAVGTSVLLRLRPATLKEQAKLEKKAARRYIWATTFDWLGSTVKAMREMERLQRRFSDIPEALFWCSLLTSNEAVKADLDVLGFSTLRALTPYPAVQALFSWFSHFLERPLEGLFYTLDLAFFTPYVVRRFLFRRGVYLGLNEDGDKVYVDPAALPNFHALYVGSSGAGKSLAARHVVLQLHLSLGANVLIIDPHGEYGEFVRALGGVEVASEEGFDFSYVLSSKALIEYLVQGAEAIYALSRPEAAILRDVLLKSKTFRDAARRLPLTLNALREPFEMFDSGLRVRELFEAERPVSVNLSRLDERAAALVAWLVLKEAELYYSSRGVVHNRVRLAIVVDEAHRIMAPLSLRLLRLVQETRKWGIAVVMASQFVSSFDRQYWAQVGHIVTFSPMDETELRELKTRVSVTTADETFILSASARHHWFPERALLIVKGWRFPVRVLVDIHPLALMENYRLVLRAAKRHGIDSKDLARLVFKLGARPLREVEEYVSENSMNPKLASALLEVYRNLKEPPKPAHLAALAK